MLSMVLVKIRPDYITLRTKSSMASRINKNLVSAFARALRTIRLEKELTQEQVAYGAKLHPTYIAFLEGRKRQPSIDTIFKIAKGLDIKPSSFMKRIESYYFTKK